MSNSVGAALKGVQIVVGVLAFGVATLGEGFSYLGTAFGALVAAFNKKITFGDALADLAQKSGEMKERLRLLAEQMGFVEKAATGLAAGADAAAQAAEKSAAAAAGSASEHLKLGLALDGAGKAYATYGENLKAAAAAEQVRQQTAVEATAMLGKESAALAAKTVAVQAGLAALQQEILAKQGEIVVARESLALAEKTAAQHQADLAQRGATLEVMAKQAAEDAVALKNAGDLVQKRQQETVALQAQAGAQSLATEKAQLAEQTYKDNAARVYELRAAYVAASETLKLMQDLHEKGVVSDTAVATAQRGLREATALYKDALADTVEKLKDKEAAESRHTALAAQAIGVDIQAAKAAQAVAQAKGDEAEAVKQGVKVKELEAAQAQAVAAGKQAEAQAAQDSAQARIAELKAVGDLTEAKKAEIAALEDAVAAKKLDAAAAEQAARANQAEADSAKKAAEAKNQQADATQSATGWSRAEIEANNAAVDAQLNAAAAALREANAAERAARANQEFSDVLNSLSQSAGDVAHQSLPQAIAAAERFSYSLGEMDRQKLDQLNQAIAQAKQQLQALQQTADATLSSLNQELAQMNGNFVEAERLAMASRRAELESKIAIANAQGNNAAATTLTQALATLDTIAGQKIAAARQREADELARSSAASSQASAAAGNLNQATGAANATANSLRSLAGSSVTMGGAATQLAATTGSVATAAASFAGAIGATQAASAQMAKAAQDLGQASDPSRGESLSKERSRAESGAPQPAAVTHNNTFNIAGVLDINDRATLDTLTRKLAPMLNDLSRRSA